MREILTMEQSPSGEGDCRSTRQTRGLRKLHSEELHNLYPSPNIIRIRKSRRTRLAGACSTHGKMIISYNILVGNPEEKKPLGTSKHTWEENIKMNLRNSETGGGFL
jgi:hypothetical protein